MYVRRSSLSLQCFHVVAEPYNEHIPDTEDGPRRQDLGQAPCCNNLLRMRKACIVFCSCAQVCKTSGWARLSHDFEFWLSPRMRLSSPDHSPLIARTRVLAIFSSCRFSSYNTASGRFYQPGETFMTHLTYSGLCCFLLFIFFKY